jgi:rhamnosyltransferase
MPLTVGLVIPTLNAGSRWVDCLAAIKTQSLFPRRLLNVDSASSDGTTSLARAAGFEVLDIARSEFSHGGTRQLAAEHLSDCDVIVFQTQDAILASRESLAELVRCFEDPRVAVAYGRQRPHVGASAIEAHAREFTYDGFSRRKDLEAAKDLGARVFFCSNSFAAYRRTVLMELGGFDRNLILGEDMEFAARAISAGYSNMYCAAATVRHSHDYSARQTMSRYFDIGVFDHEHPWMSEKFGSHRGQGLRFVASEIQYLTRRAPLQIPRSILLSASKIVGYRLGRLEHLLPLAFKRRISMQTAYWRQAKAD